MKKNIKNNSKGRNHNWIKIISQNILLCFVVCAVLFGILEMYLRIFTEPINIRVKGDEIIVPLSKARKFKRIQNVATDKLDEVIVHTTNNIGLRGEDRPDDFYSKLTILTVGGSTTHCNLISDGKTWTDLLGKELKNSYKELWINNAGFSGQHAVQHLDLMEKFVIKKIKPKIVLFLIGINDRGYPWDIGIDINRKYKFQSESDNNEDHGNKQQSPRANKSLFQSIKHKAFQGQSLASSCYSFQGYELMGPQL